MFLNINTSAIVRVKYLSPRDVACLAYKGPTCKVELYYTRFERPVLYDDLALQLGGYPHWGNSTGRHVSKFLHSFECFQNVPVHQMFFNDYLKGEHFQP